MKKILLLIVFIQIAFAQIIVPHAKPFNLDISMAQIPGYTVIDKFGINPLITTATDPEDVWEYGGEYTFTKDTGAHYFLSSSSILDSQNVKIYTLTVDSKGNWNDEVVLATLQGQTKIQLSPTSGDSLVRIYRIENEDVAGNDFNGTIYVYENSAITAGVPSTATAVRAIVNNGNNQTLMAIYTIPTGCVGFLFRGEVGIKFSGTIGTGTSFATLQYKSRRFGKVFKVKKEISIISQGSSVYTDVRSFPDPIPAKTDIKIHCTEVSENLGVWATFDILLIDEKYLSTTYLTQIGQIVKVN